MSASIEQKVEHVLDHYPEVRCSLNRLVMAFWIHMDGFPYRQPDFDRLTAAESIVREARQVFRRRPELSPEANLLPGTKGLFDDLVAVGVLREGSEPC